MLALFATELLQLEALGAAGFLVRPVIPGVAHRAFQPNVFAHEINPSEVSGDW